MHSDNIAQVVDFTPTAATAANTLYRTTINGNNYDYTSVGADTVQTIAEALQPLMTADAAVTCTEDNTKVTCTASTPGTAFTFASSVTTDAINPTFTSFTLSGGVGGFAKVGDNITISLNTSSDT
jgi:phage tail sheath gpL-like